MTSISADLDHLAPGSTVIIRDAEWLVTGMEAAGEHWFLDVIGTAGLVREQTATFYTGIDDVWPLDPRHTKVKADTSARFAKSRLWLESTIRRTAVPISTPQLTVATDALVDALPYQEAAALQALSPDNLRPRILLADAVGLGKTIEIGMILSELARRGRGERILVVTPKHVLEQMQFELWTRFALPFIRLDSAGIQRIRQELPAGRNPFTFYKRVIISIDTLKSDQYIPHLRAQKWDAVVIDESHNVTNTATLNHRLAEILAANADALILASATPHNGKKESFAELIRMLEPAAVSPDGEIDEQALKQLVIRRHRHSPEVSGVVGADWAERLEPNNIPVPASPAENAVAEELEHTWLWPEGSAPSSSSLFPWTLAKAFLSSPAALHATVRERLGRISDDDARERSALERLLTLTEEALAQPSAKYENLTDYLKKIGVARNATRRAVIFAERVPTLKWLQENLTKNFKFSTDQVAILHGGLSDVEQQEIVESFKLESSPIRVLVTGDLASEGVNLHAQCHHLIHYDIPWSLIRIEQRNGRIDRYGQKHCPEITTLLLQPDTERFAGDFRVLTRLVEREHEAHKALGDAASLIGTYNVRAEEDEILKVIQRRKELDQVVATPDEVKQQSGPTGMLARIFASPANTQSEPAPVVSKNEEPRSLAGLFGSDHDFLSHAVYEVSPTPGNEPPHGIGWTPHTGHSITTFNPPKDLGQRLLVLPQSYLKSRRVTTKLRLATTKTQGQRELVAARSADSTSAWPEAHYLSPLHPVLDWAADRVLAGLERNTIYAVHGNVDHPTVLLQGTLTNVRGQVIAATYQTVGFMHPSMPAVTVHESAQAAFDYLELATRNTAEIDASELQRLIDPAITAVERNLEFQVAAIEQQTEERVRQWQERARTWQSEAGVLVQHEALRRRTETVRNEAELAADMLPERTLVRPLVVVVPEGN